MNYTPGPWLVCDDGINVYAPETDTAITNVEHLCAADYDTQRANSKLIAAAPDLLAACETALSVLHLCRFLPKAQQASAILKQAIAKAKGSEQ